MDGLDKAFLAVSLDSLVDEITDPAGLERARGLQVFELCIDMAAELSFVPVGHTDNAFGALPAGCS